MRKNLRKLIPVLFHDPAIRIDSRPCDAVYSNQINIFRSGRPFLTVCLLDVRKKGKPSIINYSNNL